MIIRVQSSSGTKRLELSDTDPITTLFDLASKEFQIDLHSDWYLSKTRDIKDAFKRQKRAINSAHLRNGDMIYLINNSSETESTKTLLLPFTTLSSTQSNLVNDVQEDNVDRILDAMDGRIIRSRSEQFCRHPESGQCIHCVPLEPYDAEYLEHCNPPVKFLSFHAYLRKLRGGHSKGKFVRLENLDCTVRRGCSDHLPWPEGICTKCQPKPVTLDIQPYRHVDYVQFENAVLMESFLNYWRSTGNQRIGLLLGQYLPLDTPGAPPLAIRAVISAIYEPLQEATSRSVNFLCPLDALLPEHVQRVVDGLGIKVIGWIFTDLTSDNSSEGTVQHYRGSMDTFFMSAQECITAARLQNLHPNPSRDSPDGHFGSKFVTVVVTGGTNNQISFEGYQVSNVAMALERAHIIVPTYDAPELGYIRETTKEQFVPDVFYSSKDKYGNTVTRIGRPLPVEYLLVNMPAAFPIEPSFTFAQQDPASRTHFAVENRSELGQSQSFETFAQYYRDLGVNKLRTCLSNFHVLAWLAGQPHLPLVTSANDSNEGLNGLLEAVRADANFTGVDENDSCIVKWASSSPHWATMQTMMDVMTGGGSPNSASTDAGSTTGTSNFFTGASTQHLGRNNETNSDKKYWACEHCTFHNKLYNQECEVCSLPRNN